LVVAAEEGDLLRLRPAPRRSRGRRESISPTRPQSCLNELRHRANAEHSGFAASEGSRTLSQGFGVRQEPPGPLQDILAIPCENDAAPNSIEQSTSEVVLQIPNLSR